jgi:hypothetical protein
MWQLISTKHVCSNAAVVVSVSNITVADLHYSGKDSLVRLTATNRKRVKASMLIKQES